MFASHDSALTWRAMTHLHLPQGEGVQVADHQLLGHPSMLSMCTCFLFRYALKIPNDAFFLSQNK